MDIYDFLYAASWLLPGSALAWFIVNFGRKSMAGLKSGLYFIFLFYMMGICMLIFCMIFFS